MNKYESNITLKEAGAILSNAKRVLVTCHAKPDGDAFGSVVALSNALRKTGAQVDTLLVGPIPFEFQTFRGIEDCIEFDQMQWEESYDLAVICDTGAWSQLSPMKPNLTEHLDHCLIIDHHTTGDVDARWRYIDTHAAATCEIIADLLTLMDPPGDSLFGQQIIRDALFTGIATDTGWFRFSNTTSRTLGWVGRLIDAGVNQGELYEKLEQGARPAKLALMAAGLGSCRLVADGRAALMVLTRQDFLDAGAGAEDTDRLVNIPLIVGQVQLVALISDPPNRHGEGDDEVTRTGISFRSKPGPKAIDVAKLAGQFGGGGHVRASGAKVAGTIDAVTQNVADALEAAFG
jgi:phosphoesterase RecJ-like protein